MPIYEYNCEPCCLRFEMKRGFEGGVEAECPQCHKKARRVFHPAPIIFKGSGFYITDSRGKDTSSDEGKSAQGKSDKGKTEAAPEKS